MSVKTFEPKDARRQPNGSVLEARHPISATGDLTDRPGHDLGVGVNITPGLSSAHRPPAQLISLPNHNA